MNPILTLKGTLERRKNTASFGPLKLPKNAKVTSDHIVSFIKDLEEIIHFWKNNPEIAGALVSVHYTHVVAKSNRLRALLANKGEPPTNSICGAKFVWDKNEDGSTTQKHVFTHYVPLAAIEKTIVELKFAKDIIDDLFNGTITSKDTEDLSNNQINFQRQNLSKSKFLNIVLDCYYVESFGIDKNLNKASSDVVVTLYKTGLDTKQLLRKFGIHIFDDRIFDETTLRLTPDELHLLQTHAPYLISMDVQDFYEFTKAYRQQNKQNTPNNPPLPKPTNEPIIGVIDTQFNEDVYFSEWVEYTNMLNENIELQPQDYDHGTAVTSILVDGTSNNPNLEDGCGRFRVRHFGIATSTGISTFTTTKFIREIITTNKDIKVWNLSLGSETEISENAISFLAAEIDRLQTIHDVIFVISGTNKPQNFTGKHMKLGSPADSLNAIVVNSVNFQDKPASYSRFGPVLTFFNKPDVSYYGGDGTDQRITVYQDNNGPRHVTGTSFATPWITRKVAYLMYHLNLSKEVAKALIIDSATSWNKTAQNKTSMGYGVVPIHINDIIKTSNDEIHFIIQGTTDAFETYTYNIPVPTFHDKHPFYARATLTYFPLCDRNQGVDYTETEMDLHFGRITYKQNKATILAINANRQSEEGLNVIYEEEARKEYRKWDNVKQVSDTIKSKPIPRKAYENGLWGLSIKTKQRKDPNNRKPLPFAVVITLKEMNGINRFDRFKQNCLARGWFVQELNVHSNINVTAKAEEFIHFD